MEKKEENANEVEVIDLMLKFDYENNPNGEGFISPSSLFSKLGVPENERRYILEGVIDLGLFEYNTPEIGIRATYKGIKIYKDGGYRKYKTIVALKKGLNHIWKALDILT